MRALITRLRLRPTAPYIAGPTYPHVGQIDQIDNDLDHLVPRLPL